MMSNQPITLYSYRSKKPLSLSDAVSAYSTILEGAITLLYSPDSCKFLRLSNSEFEYSSAKERENHRLSNVFEARIFTPECELRWLNRKDGKGDAVLLTESPQSISEFEEEKKEIEDALSQQYLLWGEPILNPKDIQAGWQRIAEARIGKLDIPLLEKLSDKQQRICLKTREYIKILDYGNCAVIEERLRKLEVKQISLQTL